MCIMPIHEHIFLTNGQTSGIINYGVTGYRYPEVTNEAYFVTYRMRSWGSEVRWLRLFAAFTA